mmetsp:Transcript_115331/g.246478  ORF Transcript_115331/g.246478 Transcript_115331/m.246478 type:complete len:313 (+) Transcript_115331:307-1245(+)
MEISASPGYELIHDFMRRYDIQEAKIPERGAHLPNTGLQAWSEMTKSKSPGPMNSSWACPYCREYGYGYQPGGKHVTHRLADIQRMSYTRGGHRRAEGGFQSIFINMANELPNGTLRLNHKVERIRRTDIGVWVDDEECASVVVTAIPSTLSSSFGLTQEEKQIFDRLRTTPFFSAIVDIDCPSSWKPIWGYGQYDAAKLRQHDDKYMTVYGYHDLASTEGETVSKMKEAVKHHMGCEPKEVVAFKVWYDYHPRFDQADVDSGILARIEAMQGKHHTYWAGTYMNFDVAEGALAYSKHLYDAYMTVKAGPHG